MAILIKGNPVITDEEDLAIEGTASIKGVVSIGDGSAQTTVSIRSAEGTDKSEHLIFYNGDHRVGEIGAEDDTWLRINQETNKNIYTPRMIKADGGFLVGDGGQYADISDDGIINVSGSYKIDGAHQQLQLGRGDSAVTAVMDGSSTVVFPEQPRAKVFGQHFEGAGWAEDYDVTGLNHISCQSFGRDAGYEEGHLVAGTVNCIRATDVNDEGDGNEEYIMNPLGNNFYCTAVGYGSSTGWTGPNYGSAGVTFPAWGNIAHAEIESKDNGNTIRIYGSGGEDRTDVTCMAW